MPWLGRHPDQGHRRRPLRHPLRPPPARLQLVGHQPRPGPATGGRWLHVRIDYRSEWFEDEEAARRRHDELSADAGAVDTAAFRARYRLP
ncbi:MAG TPA: hypothetical protein VFQ49_02745 [Actinomycetes bacterium]|nr:hypothetical protein [Actinomycetes bacterium]